MASFQSCKKEDDKKKSITPLELLTASPWIQVDNKENGVSDWDSWEDCDKDDLTIFKNDMTYEFHDGGIKCDPNDPDLYDSGDYFLINNGTQLVMHGINIDIVTLTETDLEFIIDLNNDVTTVTFKHP